jgi:hypothetical protein
MDSVICRYTSEPRSEIHRLLRRIVELHNIPESFINENYFEVVSTRYLPIYRFQFDWQVNWSASFGYNRYVDEQRFDSPTKSWRTVQKRVTDWRPVSGSDSGMGALAAYGGHGADEPEIRTIEQSSLDQIQTEIFNGDFHGIPADTSAISPDESWKLYGAHRAEAIVDLSVRRYQQGDTSRGWHWQGPIRPSATFRLFAPISHITASYKGKKFNFRILGCDPTPVIFDSLPKDPSQILKKAIPWIICAASIPIIPQFNISFGPGLLVFLLLLAASVANHKYQNFAARQRLSAALGEDLSKETPEYGGARSTEQPFENHRQQAQQPEEPHRPWNVVLEVSVTATRNEVHAAYLGKITQYHPDRVMGLGPEFRAIAEKHSKEINRAYAEAREAGGWA